MRFRVFIKTTQRSVTTERYNNAGFISDMLWGLEIRVIYPSGYFTCVWMGWQYRMCETCRTGSQNSFFCVNLCGSLAPPVVIFLNSRYIVRADGMSVDIVINTYNIA